MKSAGKFTDELYLNIVHAFDLHIRIIFWAMAEKQFGYTAAEAVGQNPINVMVDDCDAAFAMNIAQRCVSGESWTGEFPVNSKSGERFLAVTTCSPFYDEDGSLIGVISITSNSGTYLHPRISFAKLKVQEVKTSSISARNGFASNFGLDSKGAVISKLGLGSDQPIQAAIASKMSDLASKVSNKVRSKTQAVDSSVALCEGGSGDNNHSNDGFVSSTMYDHREDAASSGARTPEVDNIHSPFGVFTCDENDGKSAICKALTSKAEEWMVKKGLSLPWKVNEQKGSKGRPTHSLWNWVQNEQEKDNSHQSNPSSGVKSEANKPAHIALDISTHHPS